MLNIGCGSRLHPDWTNIDLAPQQPTVIQVNILKGLPFDDDTFDVIYHSHVLEHLSRPDAASLLLECHRVLKKGGRLRVVIPDLEYSCRLYLESLEQVSCDADSSVLQEHYEWAVLNLIDQMVRVNSGGVMKTFVNDQLQDPQFVISTTGGAEVEYMLAPKTTQKATLASRLGNFTIKRLFQKIFSRLAALGPAGWQEFRFRRSGEVHKWMYDRHSIAALLTQLSYTSVSIKDADSSNIEGWQSFGLDVDEQGKPFKPGSVYAEATKS